MELHVTSQIRGLLLGNDVFLPVVDGVVRLVDSIYQHFLETQRGVFVVAPSQPGYQDNTNRIIRYPSFPLPRNYPYRSAFPIFTSNLPNSIVPEDMDIVHIHSPFEIGKLLHRWARRHQKPVVLTLHSKYHDKMVNSLPFRFIADWAYEGLVRFANSCDVITTPSSRFRDSLINDGIDENKIRVLRNGVPPIPMQSLQENACEDNPHVQRIRQKRREGKTILLYVGQLIREKNPEFLLEALAILKAKGFDFYSLIVGTGDQEEALKQKARELRLEEDVLFTGRIGDKVVLHTVYHLSDCFSFPSTYEVHSLVLQEAAQHGLAVMGIENASCISEFIVHGKNGYLSKLNPDDYAQLFIDAYKEPERLRLIREAVKTSVAIENSQMMAELEALYVELSARAKVDVRSVS